MSWPPAGSKPQQHRPWEWTLHQAAAVRSQSEGTRPLFARRHRTRREDLRASPHRASAGPCPRFWPGDAEITQATPCRAIGARRQGGHRQPAPPRASVPQAPRAPLPVLQADPSPGAGRDAAAVRRARLQGVDPQAQGLVERSKARRSGPSPSHRSDRGDMPAQYLTPETNHQEPAQRQTERSVVLVRVRRLPTAARSRVWRVSCILRGQRGRSSLVFPLHRRSRWGLAGLGDDGFVPGAGVGSVSGDGSGLSRGCAARPALFQRGL